MSTLSKDVRVMNYNDFFSEIKMGALQGAYLLHGDEEFVKASALRSAKETIPSDMRDFNITVMTEPGQDDILDACETLPLLSEKKLVICRGLSANIDPDKLIAYLERIPDSTVLLIEIRGSMQERSKLLKYFASIGREILFSELSEGEVIKWSMAFAAENGAVLDWKTARAFVSRVGMDMTIVSNELRKACDMVGAGGVITLDIISKCTVGNIEVRVFEMLDCFTSGKVKDGLSLLHILLEDENEALSVASFLESRFKLMLTAKRLMDTGLNPAAAVARMEGSRFANEKACKAAAKYTSEQLSSLVARLADVGYLVVSGGVRASATIESIMLTFEW